jgi:hypothetical protein
MYKSIKYVVLATGLAYLLSSCVGTRSGMLVQGKSPLTPWNYQLLFQRGDLTEVGEVADSIKFTTYLGIINSNKDFRFTKRISFPGAPSIGNRNLSRVLYYMYEKTPTSDIIIPTKVITKKERLFLGSRKTITVIGKAYKIK